MTLSPSSVTATALVSALPQSDATVHSRCEAQTGAEDRLLSNETWTGDIQRLISVFQLTVEDLAAYPRHKAEDAHQASTNAFADQNNMSKGKVLYMSFGAAVRGVVLASECRSALAGT